MKTEKQSLDTTNPDHLTYESGMLQITILGGIRMEGLDRMRATLKIQVEHLSLRHNLDLYNHTQVEKLIRKIAERLEIGTSVAAAALTEPLNNTQILCASAILMQRVINPFYL